MKKKKTAYKKPNPVLFGLLQAITKFACRFLFNVKVVRNELKGSSGRRVIIANHESVIDFLTAYAVAPKGTHLVSSKSIMRSMPIYPLAKRVGIIDKNQFQTGLSDMKRMKSVVEHGGVLMLYPAGLMTESGASTPIPEATGKVLKWFDADVYVCKVSGTYLTSPKWAKVKRKGKITLDIYKLADRDEVAGLSDDEAQTLIEEHLAFDAYRSNEEAGIPFKNGDNVEGLETVLYQCPSCGREHTITVKEKNTLTCTACGYAVKSDVYGALSAVDGGEAIFKYPSDWHAFIEQGIYEEVKENPDFSYKTRAKIFKINEKKHRYEQVGEGEVTLDSDKFVIDGIVYGEPLYKEVRTAAFPMLPFQPGERLEIQCGEDIFRIQPEDGRIVMKWILTLKVVYKMRRAAAVAAK